MRNIKYILTVLAIIFCSSCTSGDKGYTGSGVTVTFEGNDNSESESQASATESSGTQYYANKSSKKFHKETCIYAKRLSEDNLYICSSREQLIAEGYTPCGKCEP